MAPTIQNGNASASEAPRTTTRPTERKSDLICRVKYSNNLPDIPFDLKFLIYPFESNRFIQYNPTSLEKNYKYEGLTEHDLGVTIDLINRDIYQVDSQVTLDPADEKLLEEDSHAPQDSIRSRQHSRPISWLRKSEYISTEQTRFQPQNIEKIEAKVGYNVKKNLREEALLMDREAQISAIEKTFEDSKLEITRHYSKPNVTPIEVLPIYPDFNNWKYPCAQVIFDSDPAPMGKNVPAQIEVMSQAMIRGVMDESGEQFVAYFLPTEETLEKRRNDFANNVPYEEEQSYEYKIAREYNWNVKNKATKDYEENYFFTIKGDGVHYNELETRVRLSKRRVKFGQQPNNTKLIVHHRVLDAKEFKNQRIREKQLEILASDDEEEMEVDEEEPEPEPTVNNEDNKISSRSKSRSKSVERSVSRSGSESRRSRSGSRRSKSGSRSRSRSGSGSHRSKSGSHRSSKSRSSSRSRSRSRSRSATGSHRSKSGTPDSRTSRHSRRTHRSKSGTPDSRTSRSRSRSGSHRSRSGSHRSRSGSHRSRSGSHRSRSGSHRSKSGSRSRSRSGSAVSRRSRRSASQHSKSRSPSGSRKSRSSSSSNSGSDSD